MSLEIDVTQALGHFELRAAFSVGSGLTALFGPSGSGKTSLINLVGGLSRPDRGRITLGSDVLVDTARDVFVPSHRRGIGYVFQESRLFPHLTVRQNLLFGHWFAGRKRPETSDLAGVVDLLGIAHLLTRRPQGLSGGERQRVAIGRALLSKPRLLLMDEPLASLDEGRKSEIIPYIERLRDSLGLPVLYVSHSLPEVARLATTVVRFKDGHVIAQGRPGEVLAFSAGDTPALSLAEGSVVDHDPRWRLTRLRAFGGLFHVSLLDCPVGSRVRISVRATDVTLSLAHPEGSSALNILPGTVMEIGSPEDGVVSVALDCGGDRLTARVTAYSLDRLGLREGQTVFAMIKTASLDGTFQAPTAPRSGLAGS